MIWEILNDPIGMTKYVIVLWSSANSALVSQISIFPTCLHVNTALYSSLLFTVAEAFRKHWRKADREEEEQINMISNEVEISFGIGPNCCTASHLVHSYTNTVSHRLEKLLSCDRRVESIWVLLQIRLVTYVPAKHVWEVTLSFGFRTFCK